MSPEQVRALDPRLDGTLAAIAAALADGLDVTGDDVRALAVSAAMADERAAYTERGRPRGAYVGGTARCASFLELLIDRGLPRPGELLRSASWSTEVVDVLLRRAAPTRDEIDAALLATCDERSFDPILPVIRRLLAAAPTATAVDEALRRAAAGVALRRGVTIDLEFFDVFDALLAAGARPDHGAGTTQTALHVFVTLADPNAHGDRQVARRVERADAITARAIGAVTSVDVVDAKGCTPLHHACWHRLAGRAAMLIAAGADRERRDAEGQTPADYAGSYADVLAALGLPPPNAGQGASRKLTIRFHTGETRTLAASFVAAKARSS